MKQITKKEIDEAITVLEERQRIKYKYLPDNWDYDLKIDFEKQTVTLTVTFSSGDTESVEL